MPEGARGPPPFPPPPRGDRHALEPARQPSSSKLLVTRASRPAGERWELDLGAASVFTHNSGGVDSQPDPELPQIRSKPRGCRRLLAQRCLSTLGPAEEGCWLSSPGSPELLVVHSKERGEDPGVSRLSCLPTCRPHGLPGRQTHGGPNPHDPVDGDRPAVLPGGPQLSDQHGGPRAGEWRALRPDPLQAHLVLPTPRFPQPGIFTPLLCAKPAEIFFPEEKTAGLGATRSCKLIMFFKILKQQ